MTNDCLKCAGSTIVGALRVILAIICILSILAAIGMLWGITELDRYLINYTQIFTSTKYFFYEEQISSLIVSSIGLYGTCSRNRRALHWFALLTFMQSVLSLTVENSLQATIDWDGEKTKFSRRMQDYAREYQFDLSQNEQPNQATKVWDKVQATLGCCGVESKYDWKSRASNVSLIDTRLPKSCCNPVVVANKSEPEHCHHTVNGNNHEDGCWQSLSRIYSIFFPTSLLSNYIDFIGSLTLAAIALLVAQRYGRDKAVRGQHRSDEDTLSCLFNPFHPIDCCDYSDANPCCSADCCDCGDADPCCSADCCD